MDLNLSFITCFLNYCFVVDSELLFNILFWVGLLRKYNVFIVLSRWVFLKGVFFGFIVVGFCFCRKIVR